MVTLRDTSSQLTVFGFAALLVLTLAGPVMTGGGAGLTGEGSFVRQALYLLTFLVIVVSVRPHTDFARLAVLPIPMLFALAWCWISLSWSIDVGVAARRLVLTTLVVVAVFVAVRNMPARHTATVIRAILVAALLASYVTVFLFPQAGIHQFNTREDAALIGDWAGVLGHKNIAGSVCAIIVLMFALSAKSIHPVLRILVIALAAYFLFRSQSKTSIGMLGGALAIGLGYQMLQGRLRVIVSVLVFLGASAGSVFLWLYNDPFSGNFTDPEGFTGRVGIWQDLWRYFLDHPMTGAGYGSFWNVSTNSPIYGYSQGWVAEIASGHNGYLDLLVTVGIPGTLLIAFAAIVYPIFRLFASASESDEGAWPLAVLFFGAGHNFTETSLFDRDLIINVFILVSGAAIMRLAAEARRPGQRAQSRKKPDLRDMLRA